MFSIGRFVLRTSFLVIVYTCLKVHFVGMNLSDVLTDVKILSGKTMQTISLLTVTKKMTDIHFTKTHWSEIVLKSKSTSVEGQA